MAVCVTLGGLRSSGVSRLPMLRTLMLSLCCLACSVAPADPVRVAVAANFAPTLKRLADDFIAQTGHRLLISSASTGKHYAQIRNGAAFDVFLAADTARPKRLEVEGHAVTGSRFDYALGRLVVWLPGLDAVDDARAALIDPQVRRLAIANPRLAPYGLAARQVLEAWGLWSEVQPRLVRGENVGQAFQFVATGNAQAGLVALSQLLGLDASARGAYREIAAGLYAPIRQQAVLLRAGPAAESFLAYLRAPRARAIIGAAGYALPEAS